MRREGRSRVQFFSKADLSVDHNLQEAESILKDYIPEKLLGINDILELHEIKIYFDNGLFLSSWSMDQKKNYLQIVQLFWRKIINFWTKVASEEFLDLFNEVDYQYQDSFWSLLSKLDIYKRIEIQNFWQILNSDRFHIRGLLKQKKIVLHFSKEIKKYLLHTSTAAEILLSCFEEEHFEEKPKLYLPPNLKDEDKEAIVVNYLDHADANLNYVRLAINSRHIKLSDRTRLKAKRLGARLNNEILEEGMSWTEGIEVSIAEDQVEPFVFSIEKHRRKYSYSRKWLNLTRSPRMIFKNFSTFFGFINSQGCIDLVSKNCEMDTFETIAMRSKNEYFYYSGFHQKSLRSDLQLLIYLDYLKHYNIRLESILEFIVNNYLNTEYGINDLKISLPSENATILEKIRMLAPELENLVRQYQFYIEEGFIDNELLELSSSFIYFGTVPSAVNWKYAYGCGNDFKRLKNDFFSSQSMLGYVKRNKGKYRNLFLLLNSEDINYDEFKGFQKSEIDFLVSKEILLIDDEGIVEIKNKAFLEVLSILHYEEVINFWHHTEDMQKEILKMEKNGLVVLEKKLFTTEERRYLNFYLNKKEFTNGLDLRNKYLHGTNSSSTDEHEKDYYILLKLLILVIHKIEDDLSLRKRLLTA